MRDALSHRHLDDGAGVQIATRPRSPHPEFAEE